MFITFYIYIGDKSGPIPRRSRIESFGAGDAHIAARFAPVAPEGEIYTLGEHWLPCGRFCRHARHGATLRSLHWYGELHFAAARLGSRIAAPKPPPIPYGKRIK